MNLIDNFKKAKQALYDHVGFVEDWVIYPIDDRTYMYWKITEEDTLVKSATTKTELRTQEGSYYVDEIYTQRFYEKWVYRGEKLTMIFVNPGVDGMKYFAFFSNNKEVKGE